MTRFLPLAALAALTLPGAVLAESGTMMLGGYQVVRSEGVGAGGLTQVTVSVTDPGGATLSNAQIEAIRPEVILCDTGLVEGLTESRAGPTLMLSFTCNPG